MSVKLVSGTQHKVDYTPGSAVTAGDVVLIGSTLCIASVDLAANESGALNWPNGSATYEANNTDSLTFAAGDDVFYDIANAKILASGGDGKIGVAPEAIAGTDALGKFVHE